MHSICLFQSRMMWEYTPNRKNQTHSAIVFARIVAVHRMNPEAKKMTPLRWLKH